MTISSTGGCTHSASGDDANKTEEEKFSVGSESDVYMRTNELSWEEFFLELPNDDDTVREQLAAEPRKLNEQKHSESSKTLLYVENEDHCIDGFNGSPSRPEDVQNERNVVLQNEDNIVLQLDSQDRQMATEDDLQNVKSPIGTVEQSNSRSDASANKMRTLNTPQREQVTTKLSCSLEVLKQRFGMKIDDAADSLGISRSTLKRICRDNGIKVWPYRKRKKNFMNTIPHVTIPLQDANNSVTIKATYEDDIIKFKLPLSLRMDDLREKVGKRLNLEVGSFKIKHKDDDGDLVLITCDEDLQDCMCRSSRSLNRTLIDMLVVPLTNRSGFHNENAPLFV